MNIFKRIGDGLFSPTEVIKYRNDRFITSFLIFLIFSILLMIPNIISIYSSPLIDYETKIAVQEAFKTNEEIPYVIEGGRLVCTSSEEQYQYVLNIDDISICFTNQDKLAYDKNMQNKKIIFSTKAVYFNFGIYDQKILNYYEYIGIEGLDFRLAKNQDRNFWNSVFKITNEVLNNYQPWINIFLIVLCAFEELIFVFIGSLFLTLIGRISSNNIYPFKEHWRLMLYYMGPYVIGSLFSILFNTIILRYIGIIITIIYSLKINQIEFLGGNKNEL